MTADTLIVVPARWASARFPGKPLALIAGKPMLARVAAAAAAAAREISDARYVIATDDDRILDFCRTAGLPAVMTDPALPSGSDRALAAADALGQSPRFVINFQGDAPFTPVEHLTALAHLLRSSGADAATAYIRLDWQALDQLRAQKQASATSGTTIVVAPDGRALWFSKQILPLIRNETALRAAGGPCPVLRHVGLYGFRLEALRRFCALPESQYERLEGLEQLRLLENGMTLNAVEVAPGRIALPGIDTPEDLAHAERLIAALGEPQPG